MAGAPPAGGPSRPPPSLQDRGRRAFPPQYILGASGTPPMTASYHPYDGVADPNAARLEMQPSNSMMGYG